MPARINDNSDFVFANEYIYAGRIAADLPDPTTTTNTTAAGLITTTVTTYLPTTTNFSTTTTTTTTTNTPTTINYTTSVNTTTTTGTTNFYPGHCNRTSPTVLVPTLESYNPGEQKGDEFVCTC